MKIAKQILRLSRLLLTGRSRRASDWHWHDYGAWMLPTGDIVRVKDMFEHQEVARRYLEETEDQEIKSPYLEAYRRGWARLAFQPDLSIQFKRPLSSRQKSEIFDMIDEGPLHHFVIEHKFKSVQTDDAQKAKALLSVD